MLLVLANLLFANRCDSKLFTFSNKSEISISLNNFLKELVVSGCGLNIVYQDDVVKQRLEELKLNKISVKNYTLKQFHNVF